MGTFEGVEVDLRREGDIEREETLEREADGGLRVLTIVGWEIEDVFYRGNVWFGFPRFQRTSLDLNLVSVIDS